MKRILFLDQTAKLAGAELVLLDIAKFHRENCLVALFEEGPFRHLLEKFGVSVEVLAQNPIQVKRGSNVVQGVGSLKQLIPLVQKVIRLSQNYDLIYANTLKALVVGAIASFLSHRPLVFHLHDILSKEHFSDANRYLVVWLANYFATQVITVSEAARKEFIATGGRANLIQVVYNGFDPDYYQTKASDRDRLQQELGLENHFVVGHFSRLSPWKGQHILVEALVHCPDDVIAMIVGDALFGEQDYVQQLHQQVEALNLQQRVKFLGFRSNVPELMSVCNLVAHTSTSPEPCARVLVETMLCERLLIATDAGGTPELVQSGTTGWLIPPQNPQKLAEMINHCHANPSQSAMIAAQAKQMARGRFHISVMNQQLDQILNQIPIT